jgi:hypothetical protein
MFEFLRRIICVDDSAYSFGKWCTEHDSCFFMFLVMGEMEEGDGTTIVNDQ